MHRRPNSRDRTFWHNTTADDWTMRSWLSAPTLKCCESVTELNANPNSSLVPPTPACVTSTIILYVWEHKVLYLLYSGLWGALCLPILLNPEFRQALHILKKQTNNYKESRRGAPSMHPNNLGNGEKSKSHRFTARKPAQNFPRRTTREATKLPD